MLQFATLNVLPKDKTKSLQEVIYIRNYYHVGN